MPKPRLSFLFLLLLSYPFCEPTLQAEDTPNRIIFGSCIKQDKPAPILEVIAGERPDLLIFTGDNIYGDTSDMKVLAGKYQALGEKEGFKRLAESCRMLATWDDHDYGVNDGGADYPKRSESQAAFLDFWRVPQDDPRRKRAGVYHSVVLGSDGKRVQIVLLDTRFHRSALKTGTRRVGGPYYPDAEPTKTMLGESQWQWLGRQLRQPADVRLIISSIQFAPSDAGQECWANLPRERQRMLDLIRMHKANGVVFISGDRHWSEVSAIQDDVPYPIYDLTSSSLNQKHERGTPTENRYRVIEKTYHQENYGLLDINWSADPVLDFSIRDGDGEAVIRKQIRLSELSIDQ